MANVHAPWTLARVNRARSLWREGWSAASIAADLGATTRNAVMGKLDRLGELNALNRWTTVARPAGRRNRTKS